MVMLLLFVSILRYEEITSSIQVRVENVPADISVTLKSKCGRRRGEERETDRCEHVELGTEVKFAAEIKARACLESPQNFTIYPEGINQELVVEVDTICECEDCLGDGFDAEACSGRGRNECGVCNCLEGYSGVSCECDESSFEKKGGDKTCRDPKSPEQVCSGLGSCQCGTCVCHDPSRNYGLYCECDDTTCARDAQNRLCSAHGRCSCGRCICSEGWKGVDCSCSTSTASCQSPYNMEVCSGAGECACNKCNCKQDEDGGLFSGTYCEKAPGELEPCLVLKDCVECLAFNSGPLSSGDFDENDNPVCPLHCMALEYTEVMPSNATEAVAQACEFENDAGCTYRYTSILSPEKQVSVMLLLTDEGEKEVCPNVNAMAISLGMFGLIVLLGLLTFLIYKCYLVVDDRRIYAKFEQEAKQLQYAANQNPNDIYKSPITEYKNPMYGKAIN